MHLQRLEGANAMDIVLHVGLFLLGVGLVLYFAGRLAEGAIGTARGFALGASRTTMPMGFCRCPPSAISINYPSLLEATTW